MRTLRRRVWENKIIKNIAKYNSTATTQSLFILTQPKLNLNSTQPTSQAVITQQKHLAAHQHPAQHPFSPQTAEHQYSINASTMHFWGRTTAITTFLGLVKQLTRYSRLWGWGNIKFHSIAASPCHFGFRRHCKYYSVRHFMQMVRGRLHLAGMLWSRFLHLQWTVSRHWCLLENSKKLQQLQQCCKKQVFKQKQASTSFNSFNTLVNPLLEHFRNEQKASTASTML